MAQQDQQPAGLPCTRQTDRGACGLPWDNAVHALGNTNSWGHPFRHDPAQDQQRCARHFFGPAPCGELRGHRVHHERWLSGFHEFEAVAENEPLQHGDHVSFDLGTYGDPAFPSEIVAVRFRDFPNGERHLVDRHRYRRVD